MTDRLPILAPEDELERYVAGLEEELAAARAALADVEARRRAYAPTVAAARAAVQDATDAILDLEAEVAPRGPSGWIAAQPSLEALRQRKAETDGRAGPIRAANGELRRRAGALRNEIAVRESALREARKKGRGPAHGDVFSVDRASVRAALGRGR